MKVVWVNGTFDVMHIGHIKLLEFAKGLGDVLVVGIDRDHRVTELKGSPRPINKCQYRIDFLKSISKEIVEINKNKVSNDSKDIFDKAIGFLAIRA